MAISLNKLHSLFVEQTNVNGSLLTVHYLVKNSPFKMDLQTDAASVEGLKLRLFTHDTDREVKLAKNEPLTFRVLPTPSGRNLVTVEVRIQVLSSSMEGSLFVIVAEKGNGRVSTQPLKVVSKLEQVRAAIKRAGGSALAEEPSTSDDETVDEFPAPNLKKRKVPVSDQVLHELELIKKQQQQQFSLLSTLAKLHAGATPTAISELVDEDASVARPSKRRKLTDDGDNVLNAATPTFEQAMGAFFTAFAALPAEDRSTRMACFLAQSSSHTDTAAEISSLLAQASGSSQTSCLCTGCPYRTQMNALFAQLLPTDESQSEATPDFTNPGFMGYSDPLHA